MLPSSTTPYRDRQSAGHCLAHELGCYAGLENVVVLGLPRGGIVVASEVAKALQVPLDIFVVQRIWQGSTETEPIGAMASGGVCILNQEILHTSDSEAYAVADVVVRVREQVLAYEGLYRGDHAPVELRNENIILVDDGASSGRSLRAAIAALRSYSVASITVALPVSSEIALTFLRSEADDVICPFAPDPFYSIGLAYERFPHVSDREVRECLIEGNSHLAESALALRFE